LNDAKAARDTADDELAAQLTKKETEADKIAGAQTTYDEKVAEKTEARDIKILDDAANALYGREETAAEPAIVGVEQKVRNAEKQFNEAHVELSQAEEALFNNQDPQSVHELIQAIRDAQNKVDTKENAMIRAQEHFHLLE